VVVVVTWKVPAPAPAVAVKVAITSWLSAVTGKSACRGARRDIHLWRHAEGEIVRDPAVYYHALIAAWELS